MIDLCKLFDVKPNQPFFIKKTKYKISEDNKLLRYDITLKAYHRSMMELNEITTLRKSDITPCKYTGYDLETFKCMYKKGMRYMYSSLNPHNDSERIIFASSLPGTRVDEIYDIGLILKAEGMI